ncbi:MAG: histidine kinase, partial [Bacteroidota bacterium]|nr:histidine kinase [Bacteroidota bacterium]
VVLLFFEATYFLPYYWYPGWNTGTVPAPVAEVGWNNFYLLVFLNSLPGMMAQIFFTYAVIYFLLPKYLVKGTYKPFALALPFLLLASMVLFFFAFKWGNPIVARIVGRTPRNWQTSKIIGCAVDLVLFNCPAIAGVALSIKLLKRWKLKQKQALELIKAKTNAELQLLKAQVHPHFLFNTLNNIFSFILNSSPKAQEMIRKLSGLLHYIIYECNCPQVALEKELKMLGDYMSLEKIRYGDEMDMAVDIRGNVGSKMIAPLLLIPFVENSFKHGTSKMLSRPWVNLNIIIENERFYFMLNNSKPDEYIHPNNKSGIGLTNVQKRLGLLYPGNYELLVTEESQHYTVLLEINLQPPKEVVQHNKKIVKVSRLKTTAFEENLKATR